MLKKILITIIATLALSIASMPLAQATGIPPEFRPINEPFDLTGSEEEGEQTPSSMTITLLQILAGGLLFFAAPVAVIMIVISGLTMVIGGAETDKVEQSKKSLVWSIVGLAVVMFSYSIVRIIISFVITAAETGQIGSS